MSFRVAICSADPLNRTACQTLCSEYFAQRPGGCVLLPFAAGADLLEELRGGMPFDLFLLDIQPGRADGLTAAQALRAAGVRAPIIFTAGGPEQAYEAFRVDALQYLLRPVDRRQLFDALDRAVEPQAGPVLAVTTPQGLRGVAYHDIVYVECTDHVLHFHRADGTVLRSSSLRVPFVQAAAPLLRDPRFLQPHRSYVVNLDQVERLSRAGFEMSSGVTVPIPREKYAEIRARYLRYLQAPGRE